MSVTLKRSNDDQVRSPPVDNRAPKQEHPSSVVAQILQNLPPSMHGAPQLSEKVSPLKPAIQQWIKDNQQTLEETGALIVLPGTLEATIIKCIQAIRKQGILLTKVHIEDRVTNVLTAALDPSYLSGTLVAMRFESYELRALQIQPMHEFVEETRESQRLNIMYNPNETNIIRWIQYLAKEKVELTKLSLQGCKVTSKIIPVLEECCPRLQELRLDQTNVGNIPKESPIWKIPRLNFSHCPNMDPLPLNEWQPGLNMTSCGIEEQFFPCEAEGLDSWKNTIEFRYPVFKDLATYELYCTGRYPMDFHAQPRGFKVGKELIQEPFNPPQCQETSERKTEKP